MQYSLGTPIFTTYGIIDTGSSMVWLQCKPSISSYNQGHLQYLNTDVFRNLIPVCYESQICNEAISESATYDDYDEETCQCKYQIEYDDGADSTGHVFQTLLRLQTRLGNYVGFPMFIFGYSQMKFGQLAAISGPDVISTPMITEPTYHYYISMEGIMVGNNWVSYPVGQIGNMLMDSGTVSSYLPIDFYIEFEAEVEEKLDLLHERIIDPTNIFSLCYLRDSVDEMGGSRIAFHLRGGELVLSAENIYITVVEGVVCLNFIPDDAPVAILGTITQANFMVSYDLQRTQISFKKMNCDIQD